MRFFLVVGLTGGIATGKSTVSAIFRHLGVRLIDADLLARETVMPGQRAYREIVAEFGTDVLQPDKTLDRKKLGAIVFADAAKRKRLEAITHPAIRQRQERILSSLEEEAFEGLVIWDAALLYESGAERRVDKVVVVVTDPETQLRRLVERDGLGEEEARRRIASQMPLALKRRMASYVIDNSGSRLETERQVREVHRRLLEDLRAFRAGRR